VTWRAAGCVLASLGMVAAPGFFSGAAASAFLVVEAEGVAIMREPLGPDGRWCLVWEHSVTGITVSDCFRAEGASMVLERSHQPDFAAGLGEVPGRGTTVSDGAGGYWIEGIEAPMPDGVALRRGGPAVAHRVRIAGAEHPLPGAQGERLVLRLVTER
jgi:hypothetical protein